MRRKRRFNSLRDSYKNIDCFCASDLFLKACGVSVPVIKYGQGSKLYDYDGRAFIDLCLGNGSLIFGHAHKNIVLASKKTSERGLGSSFLTREELDFKHYIKNMISHVESVRFAPSDKEAIYLAVLSTVIFTKRNKVITFGRSYPHLFNFSDLNVVDIEKNDIESFEDIIKNNKDEIACVVLEPIATRMGLVAPDKKFVEAVVALARKSGILVVLDETTSGFHGESIFTHLDMKIVPDIVCLGKVLGGGFSLGAFCGRKSIVEALGSREFFRNPVVFKAGLAACRLVGEKFIVDLNKKSSHLEEELNALFSSMGVQLRVESYGSMMRWQGSKIPYADLFSRLFGNGVLLPFDETSPFYISCMHSKKDMSDILSSFKLAL